MSEQPLLIIICEFGPCSNPARYNTRSDWESTGEIVYCKDHKEDGMIDVLSGDGFCNEAGCGVKTFGIFNLCKRHFKAQKGRGVWSPKEAGHKYLINLLTLFSVGVSWAGIVVDDIGKGAFSEFPLKCLICFYEWVPTVNNIFNKGVKCTDCSGKARWTRIRVIEFLKKYLPDLDGSMITDEHVQGVDSKVPISCKICFYRWNPTIGSIQAKNGCPSCSGVLKWTRIRIIEWLKKHRPYLDGSLITDDHVQGVLSKIPISCKKCSYTWNPTIGNLINGGYGCPDCSKRAPWTFVRFNEWLKKHRPDLDGSMIKCEDIQSCNSIISLKCKKCSHIWTTKIKYIVRREQGCPDCSGSVHWNSLSRLLKKLEHRTDLDLSMIKDKHVKSKESKIPLGCKKCSHVWRATISSVVNKGYGCPLCKNKTEAKLFKFLQELYSERATEIKHDYRQKWCRNPETGFLFPFDIFMFLNLFKIIFELDGPHHFKVVASWKSNPEEIQDRDIYKTNMALENGHYIIRLNQEEVWSDKGNWKQQLIDLVEEIVSGKFEAFEQFYINKEHWEHFAEE
jgi:hypothetical protein